MNYTIIGLTEDIKFLTVEDERLLKSFVGLECKDVGDDENMIIAPDGEKTHKCYFRLKPIMNPTLQQLAQEYAERTYPLRSKNKKNPDKYLGLRGNLIKQAKKHYTAGYTAHAASVQEVTESLYKIIDYAYSHDGISDGAYGEIQEQLEKLKQVEQ